MAPPAWGRGAGGVASLQLSAPPACGAAPINSLAGISKQSYPTRPYLSGVKHLHLYVTLVLAISGIAVLGVSMTMIHSETRVLLGVVLGGVLVLAGIAAFASDWSRVRRTKHRVTAAEIARIVVTKSRK